jgi:hypothetical protein
VATSKRSLQLRQDPAFERWQWRVQRAGWLAIAVFLLLALLGAFGKGPLSHASVTEGNLQVTYDRFVHANAPTSLHLRVMRPAAGTVRVAINREYLDAVTFDHMRPRALRVVSAGEDIVYEFASPETGDLQISIEATPRDAGHPDAQLKVLDVPGALHLHFQQLIYP